MLWARYDFIALLPISINEINVIKSYLINADYTNRLQQTIT